MNGQGISLGKLYRIDESIKVFDDLISRFGNSTEPVLQDQVAMAMTNKDISLSMNE